MEKVPLLEYARKNGQHRTAKDLKISQGAVSKAISAGRNIFVYQKNGKLFAEEIRAFPVARHDGRKLAE